MARYVSLGPEAAPGVDPARILQDGRLGWMARRLIERWLARPAEERTPFIALSAFLQSVGGA